MQLHPAWPLHVIAQLSFTSIHTYNMQRSCELQGPVPLLTEDLILPKQMLNLKATEKRTRGKPQRRSMGIQRHIEGYLELTLCKEDMIRG